MAACERAFYPETMERKVARCPRCWHSAVTGLFYNKGFCVNFNPLTHKLCWQGICYHDRSVTSGVFLMAFRPLPAKAPAALLREAKPLKALFSQAQRLGHLQRLLESQLQPAAREFCRVASWREGTLLLVVTDGHWATRLRYQQKRLQRDLTALEEFASLTRILFKVQPPTVQSAAAGHSIDLSVRSAENIQATAEGITNPGLRAALERLASHGKPKI